MKRQYYRTYTHPLLYQSHLAGQKQAVSEKGRQLAAQDMHMEKEKEIESQSLVVRNNR